jgi:simple sugar transport system ATP-binding protein/ribose transport system ATP-binding protein
VAGVGERTTHVEIEGVSKRFGGVLALDRVSLEIEPGSIHALVGENGAGKSTLGKIVAGVLQADEGRLLLRGEEVAFRSPREALESGISMIAQELMIVPQLSAAQNVYLGAEPRRAGWLQRRALRRRYQELARSAGFDLPADRPAGRMRTAEQQQVEILRALSRDSELIVMDEPTAALGGPDIERLHEIVRSLARSGKTILLVSHFLREVLELADRVTILRDGRIVRTRAASEETEQSLIQGMLGRSLGATFPDKSSVGSDAPVVLSARDVQAPGVNGVSLELRRGEILGVAGLVGAGRTELARAIYGADRRSGGVIEFAGGALAGGPRGSLRHGLAMIPESRKGQGLLFGRSVLENVSLSSLGGVSRGGVVNRRAERAAASEILDRWALKSGSYAAPVGSLSGGNQQKVLFARMLMCKPSVLIADEPTRGVDVGAKRSIYELLVSLAEQGLGVLLISSEIEEILGLAHRVLVMRAGRVAAELSGDEMTESAILAAAFADRSAA